MPIARAHRSGWFDSLEIDRTGLVRLTGWTRGDLHELLSAAIYVDAEVFQPSSSHRTFRPDVAASGHGDNFSGFVLEFYLVRPSASGAAELRVTYENDDLLVAPADLRLLAPGYSHLFNEFRVLHRADIYCYGPPATEVSEEVYALARAQTSGPRDPVADCACRARGPSSGTRSIAASPMRRRSCAPAARTSSGRIRSRTRAVGSRRPPDPSGCEWAWPSSTQGSRGALCARWT